MAMAMTIVTSCLAKWLILDRQIVYGLLSLRRAQLE